MVFKRAAVVSERPPSVIERLFFGPGVTEVVPVVLERLVGNLDRQTDREA